MSNKQVNKQVIEEFMKAVYGEYSELAMASFNEIEALKTAMEIITELRKDKTRLQKWVSDLQAGMYVNEVKGE